MESYIENVKKIETYEKEFSTYNKYRYWFFKYYFKIYHRLEVTGKENLPDGPGLVAATHGGGFDLDIVALSDYGAAPRKIHTLIDKQWHFLNSKWGQYWVGSGIPLWTRGGIRYEYIDPYLDTKGSRYPALVSIYPEGHSGILKNRLIIDKFFPGVVRVALKYKVPIVPAGMIGFREATPILAEMHRDHGPNTPSVMSLPLPMKLKIEFGEPFTLSAYYGKSLTKAEEWWIANNIVRPRVFDIMKKHKEVILGEVDQDMKEP